MIIVFTSAGGYFLDNVTRFDFTKEKNKSTWTVFFHLDSFKIPVYHFECPKDASCFMRHLIENFLNEVTKQTENAIKIIHLKDLCKAALQVAINGENTSDSNTENKDNRPSPRISGMAGI